MNKVEKEKKEGNKNEDTKETSYINPLKRHICSQKFPEI